MDWRSFFRSEAARNQIYEQYGFDAESELSLEQLFENFPLKAFGFFDYYLQGQTSYEKTLNMLLTNLSFGKTVPGGEENPYYQHLDAYIDYLNANKKINASSLRDPETGSWEDVAGMRGEFDLSDTSGIRMGRFMPFLPFSRDDFFREDRGKAEDDRRWRIRRDPDNPIDEEGNPRFINAMGEDVSRRLQDITDQLHKHEQEGSLNSDRFYQFLYGSDKGHYYSRRAKGGGFRTQGRDQKGRFLPYLEEEEIRSRNLSMLIHQITAENYTLKGIKESSHTLKLGLWQSRVALKAYEGGKKGFAITHELPDTQRPPRANEPAPVPIRYYGPLVFYGRPPVTSIGKKQRWLRFNPGNAYAPPSDPGWISTQNVRGTMGQNVFEFSEAQKDRIKSAIKKVAPQLIEDLGKLDGV